MRLLVFPALIAVCWSTIVVLIPARPINTAHIRISSLAKGQAQGPFSALRG